MNTDKPFTLTRSCDAIMIPSGEQVTLSAGTTVWLTQAVGNGYTVMTDRGHSVRIDGRDGDVLGLARIEDVQPSGFEDSVEDQVWRQLRSCFDPEIPVNIVELGLVYTCQVQALAGGGHKAVVRFTLTSQGCGMGQFIREDIRKKLLAMSIIREADVDLVWEPQWNQSMISVSAKQQLGIE